VRRSAFKSVLICLLSPLLGNPLPSMAAPPAAKRVAPAPVRPLTVAGIRYDVVLATRARGLPQEGGYVAATDRQSGTEIWLQRIYETHYAAGMEEDVQDVFIRQMSVGKTGRTLEIIDELDRHHSLDLTTRQVRQRCPCPPRRTQP